MKKSLTTAFILLLIAAGVGFAVFWWVNSQPSAQQEGQKPDETPAMMVPTEPTPLRPLEEATVRPEPDLAGEQTEIRSSTSWTAIGNDARATDGQRDDQQVRNAINGLITPAQIAQFFQLEPFKNFARRLVATIDGLPREHASPAIWPIKPMPGNFVTGSGGEDHPVGMTSIHASNAVRYQPFVEFIVAINSTRAVALYQKLYPIFQQAYFDLGYPQGSFHARLVEVIEHLISLPVQEQALSVSRVEIKGPFRPVRPWLTYQFTDPALNALSAGQKMLLRTGSVNHQRLRDKLIELKALLIQMPQPQPG